MKAEWDLKDIGKVTARAAHHWEAWVPTYLATRYLKGSRSGERVLGAWKTWTSYLQIKGVDCPEKVTREMCMEYVGWRNKEGRYNSKIRERIVHRVATASDGIERDHAEMLHVSFEIAMAQGWRLMETCVPIAAISFDRWTATIRVKGGRMDTRAINPSIRPLLEQIAKSQRQFTWPVLKGIKASFIWWKFFDYLRSHHPGFGDVSFHSTRVSFISKMERAGVPEPVVMKMVGHASSTVHRIYRRIQDNELDGAWAALNKNQKSENPDVLLPTSETIPGNTAAQS